MTLKNSRKWFAVVTVVGLLTGFQGAAHAAGSSNWLQSLFGNQDASNGQNPPDQKQVNADLASATQFQQAYQNDRQALEQAYRSGDRQNIQNLQSAMAADVGRLQANAQDLAKDGVTNPNPIPTYQPTGQGPNGRRWSRRASEASYYGPDNRSGGDLSGYDHSHDQDAPRTDSGYYRHDHRRREA